MRTTAETGRTACRARGQTVRPTICSQVALWARRSLDFCFLRNRHRQRKQIDEAFGVFRVVTGHGKAREALAVERIGRCAPCNRDVAFVKLEAHGARDAL